MIWIDANISPLTAKWMVESFNIETISIRDLGLLRATDCEIFRAARDKNVILMTKDRDFIQLLDQHGPPPKVIWLTCGNTSNKNLAAILNKNLILALKLLNGSDSLVEIS